MTDLQQEYDDAMFAFSQGDYDACIGRLRAILAHDPRHFDAQLSLGMALCRIGDYAAAIAEGHKAEKLNPRDQLVHTNLSLFYLKAGNKAAAEHHAMQSRIASWRDEAAPSAETRAGDAGLPMARPGLPAPGQLPPKTAELPKTRSPASDEGAGDASGAGPATTV